MVCKRNNPFVGKAAITWYSRSNNTGLLKTETVSAESNGYCVSVLSSAEELVSVNYHAYVDISYLLDRSRAVANFTVQ